MPFLVAAVVLAIALGTVNLLLCVGIIRRLREHTELLDNHAAAGAGRSSVMLGAGATVADFEARTVDGERVTQELLAEPTLVGFFSLDCEACLRRLPEFVALAERHPGGPAQVLAVVVGTDETAAAPVVAELVTVARVIRDGEDGSVPKAFGVEGFPAFAQIGPGGVVRASGYQTSALAPVEPATP